MSKNFNTCYLNIFPKIYTKQENKNNLSFTMIRPLYYMIYIITFQEIIY